MGRWYNENEGCWEDSPPEEHFCKPSAKAKGKWSTAPLEDVQVGYGGAFDPPPYIQVCAACKPYQVRKAGWYE